MKAAILYKANTPLEVVDVEQQGPQAGEARVRVMATGVCHSDWHVINGDWTLPLPMVLGHEGAGIVEEAGPGGPQAQPGERTPFSSPPPCGPPPYLPPPPPAFCAGPTTPPSGVVDGTHRI